MTAAVRAGINDLISEVAREAGIETTDIVELTVAGNPIMHHLFLGISPVELGSAPFALATDEAVNLWAPELNLNVNKGARVYVLPCIAGHVGADAAAKFDSPSKLSLASSKADSTHNFAPRAAKSSSNWTSMAMPWAD